MFNYGNHKGKTNLQGNWKQRHLIYVSIKNFFVRSWSFVLAEY